MSRERLDWREAWVRGLRTFAQHIGGALSAVQLVDAVAPDVRLPVTAKLWAALIGALIAGAGAFFSNLGAVSPLPRRRKRRGT